MNLFSRMQRRAKREVATGVERARTAARTSSTDWDALTERSLEELKVCDSRFRPTSFWGPGLDQLLDDMAAKGLDSFKSWPTSGFWFYPRYGNSFTNATIATTFAAAQEVNPSVREPWFRGALTAAHEARRDFDVARIFWNQQRWPADLDGLGESMIGKPTQYFRFTAKDHGWTRPYVNYLLCMAALSHHVDAPPKRVLELGGGFGVLGEILLSRDPEAVYVDLDIPPLLTVASYYLTSLFGSRITSYVAVPDSSGPIDLRGSAVLPNYRFPDISGPFDVFVNSFSFQEMEPDVVESYVDQVVSKDVTFIVSLNSRLGKPKVADGNDIGVVDPVTSARIVEMFEKRGYDLLATHDSPVLNSAGQLVVLKKR